MNENLYLCDRPHLGSIRPFPRDRVEAQRDSERHEHGRHSHPAKEFQGLPQPCRYGNARQIDAQTQEGTDRDRVLERDEESAPQLWCRAVTSRR